MKDKLWGKDDKLQEEWVGKRRSTYQPCSSGVLVWWVVISEVDAITRSDARCASKDSNSNFCNFMLFYLINLNCRKKKQRIIAQIYNLYWVNMDTIHLIHFRNCEIRIRNFRKIGDHSAFARYFVTCCSCHVIGFDWSGKDR